MPPPCTQDSTQKKPRAFPPGLRLAGAINLCSIVLFPYPCATSQLHMVAYPGCPRLRIHNSSSHTLHVSLPYPAYRTIPILRGFRIPGSKAHAIRPPSPNLLKLRCAHCRKAPAHPSSGLIEELPQFRPKSTQEAPACPSGAPGTLDVSTALYLLAGLSQLHVTALPCSQSNPRGQAHHERMSQSVGSRSCSGWSPVAIFLRLYIRCILPIDRQTPP